MAQQLRMRVYAQEFAERMGKIEGIKKDMHLKKQWPGKYKEEMDIVRSCQLNSGAASVFGAGFTFAVLPARWGFFRSIMVGVGVRVNSCPAPLHDRGTH